MGRAAAGSQEGQSGGGQSGGVGIGVHASVFVFEGGGLRKSSESVGEGGVVFELIEGDDQEQGFMVLYCEDVEGGGGGLLRVIELKGFAVVDEYECDVAVTCMLMHDSWLWCGGSDGAIYAMQVKRSEAQPQLQAPVILNHHSFLIR
jgi:hypothetical protein